MGYFYKILKSDLFILSDDVQFSNSKTGDMHNYNYIKGPMGRQKITLPVQHPHGELIKNVRIFRDEKQIRGILKAIEQYYSKSTYFGEVYPDVQHIFEFGYDLLAEFNIGALRLFCERLSIKTPIECSPGFTTKKDARIIEMCRFYMADTYLSGSGAVDYHVLEDFTANGIDLIYSDYSYDMVIYPQRYGEFVPNLSVLDWIFNMGYTLPEGWLKNG
jgi:hypothetical protein